MGSLNFEFIRFSRPELADLGGFAEMYVYTDPESTMMKLRAFGEAIAIRVFFDLGFIEVPQMTFAERLNSPQFRDNIPKVIQDKLHLLRIQGNNAAHGGHVAPSMAMTALSDAFDLAKWLFLTFLGGKIERCSQFVKPPLPANASKVDYEHLRKETDKIKQQLKEQELLTAELLNRLGEARSTIAIPDHNAVEKMLTAGQIAVDELNYDEATTRGRLIDAALTEVGWDVRGELESSEQVGKEVKLTEQPTKSGIGYADYVLWSDSHLPLAVIEAKKTSVSEEIGRKQAKDYADSLEKLYNHRPVIFYSNGHRTKIWNDCVREVPREVYGFYSKDSLEYRIHQRSKFQNIEQHPINIKIVDREYQFEAIKRVCALFANSRRKALIVQATGTGKTRVAIALVDLLLQAGWVKRVLFLCDRTELRTQAKNAFNNYIGSEPLTLVNEESTRDKTSRIFLSTYPGMMQRYQCFDSGFFDLIIADESHRSIYNRYRELFQYFDSLQVGLTATPVDRVARNTYKLFGCEDGDPTAHYSYEEALEQRYLVPFEVQVVTTEFLRKGIKYADLTPEQQAEADEAGEDADCIEFEQKDVSRNVFNRDTERIFLQNLMENGIKDASGMTPGKSIIFARSHAHAAYLQELFEELYPQYGGDFCRLIDNQEPRAEQLIQDFKGNGKAVEEANNLPRIAISVDMLDTGVDIPEVVNLVLAKPVRSFVKFWQMIGRGTRLRPDLFGPGKDKEKFIIFDHWNNFAWFDVHYKEREELPTKSLLQILFEARIDLAEQAIKSSDVPASDLATKLLLEDMADLPEKSISVRDKYREVRIARQKSVLQKFDVRTKSVLITDIAPLMQWRNIHGELGAYRFDLLTARLQVEHLKGSGKVQDLRAEVLDIIRLLPITIDAVREKNEYLQSISHDSFWEALNVSKLEEMRLIVRQLVRFIDYQKGPNFPPKELSITEVASGVHRSKYNTSFAGQELNAYRIRVRACLEELFETSPVLQKIKSGQRVTESELDTLCSLVLTQRDIDIKLVRDFFPETKDLQIAIRRIIGMDIAAVKQVFASFIAKHLVTLTAKQMHFISLLKSQICKNGAIEIDELYEDPFTGIDSKGIDGLFHEESQIQDLLDIVDRFKPNFELTDESN